jgi:hypothetical protein
MISGLLKLMCRLSVTGYRTDFEVPLKTHFIIDGNVASILERYGNVLTGLVLECIMMYNLRYYVKVEFGRHEV